MTKLDAVNARDRAEIACIAKITGALAILAALAVWSALFL